MNGIDPPMPMSTGSVPHDVANAHRAARIASESAGARNGLPCSPSRTVTRAPNGACDSRCVRSAAIAAAGSWPGASRTESFAVARGVRVFDACATLGASSPITAIAGLVHSRPAMLPSPARTVPSRSEESARKSASA